MQKSYIEEGEFDANGRLVFGRRIFGDGACEFVGGNLSSPQWDTYLNKHNHAAWKQTIDQILTSQEIMSHEEHIIPIANYVIFLQMKADM